MLLRRHGNLSRVLGGARVLALLACALAQTGASHTDAQGSSQSKRSASTLTIHDSDLQNPTTVIAYGDMRFTDPGTLPAENVKARRALVARVAQERPDAVLLNGDLTMHGGDPADYAIYRDETAAWRDAHLRIFPVPGNHEYSNCEVSQCLQNWWGAFPQLRDHRWYSAQLGTKIYLMGLDSNTSLLPRSPQYEWVESQLASLPKRCEFVLITMHHEPVGDIQAGADDNPRPNEMALADLLKTESRKSHAKLIVIAGHIHNYERFEQDGVAYLVSGGGGAPQQTIDRNSTDLYKDKSYPNFHYVKFVLQHDTLAATMWRLTDPDAPMWESKDSFKVKSKKKADFETQLP
jgi:acid phosphatase type 7